MTKTTHQRHGKHWKKLVSLTFIDVSSFPQGRDFTYVQASIPTSRIDGIWINNAFADRCGGLPSAKTAVTQHAIFFQRFSTCYFFFQHAIFHFNMLFFSCIIFNMLFFAGPFFNMLFHVFNMLFFSAPISTCYFFNMLFLHMTFQHAKFCKTIFEHAIFYFNCNVGMVNPAWGMSVDYLRGRVGAKYLGSSPISVHPWCHGHGCFITAAVPSKELMLTT
jgi:hypothetical protein